MTHPIRLYDYQTDIKQRLAEEWQTHRSVMLQMPTGTGKTHVLASVVKEVLSMKNGEWVWIIAHRRELVAQIEETVGKYGIDLKESRIRVLSIQWLTRHWDDMGEAPSLVVIDEAHHAQARTYRVLWERCQQAKFLGLTATPCRMDRSGFTDLFDTLVCSWSIAGFIGRGYLSLFDYVSIRRDSEVQHQIDSLEKRGADGDYQIKEMDTRLNRHPNIEKLYESVRMYAGGRKGIVYAISIGHARNIAAYYSQKGLEAAAIDSRTPMAERKRLVEDFRRGNLQVLVNVDVFSEGFDCPDVEFVQLARPTLSLSKYLQQVGRGLRKAKGKEACVLIDNVGLYRVFGLPTVAWDWESMFRGVQPGKGTRAAGQQPNRYCPAGMHLGSEERDDGMEIIVSHDKLLSGIVGQRRVQTDAPPKKLPGLRAWQDEKSGLWGLQQGEKKRTEPIFVTVFDVRYDMAAVRFRDNHCGVVSADGEKVWESGHCLSMRFSKNFFLTIRTAERKFRFVDLRSLQMYHERPEVKRFGGVELLKIGNIYYSRTRKRYVNDQHLNSDCISDYRFYVAIFDYKVPTSCCIQNSCTDGYQEGYVCLLSGDDESFYYVYRWLADGSIIVTDGIGKYYHVAEGKGKEYIGCCDSVESGNRCRDAIEHISRRVQGVRRNLETKKTEQRMKLPDDCEKAVPFRSGMKWGLRVGERITVPPVYRNVKPPVGKYCAVEKNYSQWGIITVDGTILVEPKYQEIDIGNNGMAVLTFVTGKKVAIKL